MKLKVLIPLTVIVVALAGCEKEEEIPMVTLEEYEALGEELNTAYAMIDDGVKVSDMGVSSLKVVNGATTDEFEFTDNKFVLPTPLTIDGATEDVSASNIQIGSFFKFSPSDNWIVRLGGTQMHLNHPIGITGQITALNIRGFDLFNTDFKEKLLQYSKSIPTKASTYHSLYVGSYNRGAIGIHDISVNGADGQLVVGLVAFGDVALSMAFVLDGKDRATQLELTKLLISSGYYVDSKIRIE